MTKYILHGGNTREINADNNSFFREITLGTTGNTLVLLNYFAREDDEIKTCAEQDKKRFLENSENKNLAFEIAQKENFIEQLSNADIMYIRGGETSKLIKEMSPIKDIKKLFENKTIAGSSAGVYVLSKYYWENDTDIFAKGLGIFNFKALCHYEPERNHIVKKLMQYGEPLPLLTLANYKWVVLFDGR